jgi:hypothetical protein
LEVPHINNAVRNPIKPEMIANIDTTQSLFMFAVANVIENNNRAIPVSFPFIFVNSLSFMKVSFLNLNCFNGKKEKYRKLENFSAIALVRKVYDLLVIGFT